MDGIHAEDEKIYQFDATNPTFVTTSLQSVAVLKRPQQQTAQRVSALSSSHQSSCSPGSALLSAFGPSAPLGNFWQSESSFIRPVSRQRRPCCDGTASMLASSCHGEIVA